MNRFAAFAVLGLFWLSATASAQPLPPIIAKYIAAVHQARTLSVEITQTYRFLPVKKPALVSRGTFRFEHPNKFAVACGDTFAVSDGKTVSEWDSREYTKQNAPDTLEAMLTPLRCGLMLRGPGSVAASLAFIMFTHPDALAALASLQDRGIEQVNEVETRKITALTPGASADFWFASKTGLPVQAVVSETSSIYIVRFLQYQINTPVPDSVFAAIPPAGLTRMGTEHEALHFLEPGTPAPDFTLKTPDGKTQTLSALQGRAVLIVFCPLWSLPEKGLAAVQEAHSGRAAKDFAVLWIVGEDKPERIAKFVQAHPSMTVLVDSPPWPETVERKLYHVQATPTFYVVSRTGQVVRGFLGVLPDGETKTRIISADTRAAAVSVLLFGTVTQDARGNYDQIDDMADEPSLEAALSAAEAAKNEKQAP